MVAEKDRLDNFIGKQRVAMYKPIQIAEILYRVRLQKDGMSLETLDNVENYRNPSKRWRDEVTRFANRAGEYVFSEVPGQPV